MKTYFAKFGELDDSGVVNDRMTGKSRGFGFITYKTEAERDKCLAATHEIGGRRIDVKKPYPRGSNPNGLSGAGDRRSAKIFVGRMPPTMGDEDLRAHYSKYGELGDVYVPKNSDKTGHRGFGFVTFTTADLAEEIIRKYGECQTIGDVEVNVKIAVPKEAAAAAVGGRGRGGRGAFGGFGARGGGRGGGYGRGGRGGYGRGAPAYQDPYGAAALGAGAFGGAGAYGAGAGGYGGAAYGGLGAAGAYGAPALGGYGAAAGALAVDPFAVDPYAAAAYNAGGRYAAPY